MKAGFIDFEFDLPGALLGQLISEFRKLNAVPLSGNSLQGVPEEQGVYQLFLDGELVYIGKTDSDAGLRRRLERHERKIQHRPLLDRDRVSFKAVRVYVFTAVDLEGQLIKEYGGAKKVPWNGSGLGRMTLAKKEILRSIKTIILTCDIRYQSIFLLYLT